MPKLRRTNLEQKVLARLEKRKLIVLSPSSCICCIWQDSTLGLPQNLYKLSLDIASSDKCSTSALIWIAAEKNVQTEETRDVLALTSILCLSSYCGMMVNVWDSARFARKDLLRMPLSTKFINMSFRKPRKTNVQPIPLVYPLIRYLRLEVHKQVTLNYALQFRGKQPGSPSPMLQFAE